MAKQPSKSSHKSSDPEATVTRIKASGSKSSKSTTKPATAKKAVVKTEFATNDKKRRNPFRAMADYFAGAWYELRQVRWPDRKATWGMTGALLAFTAFFVVLVLLLDALFKYIFQLIIG